MRGNPIQQGGHHPQGVNAHGQNITNVPRGQNIAQRGGMNIPPAVQMNHRVRPRLNENWRVLNRGPQHPVHSANGNIQMGHRINLGQPQRPGQAPRQAPIIHRGPPPVQAPLLQAYGPILAPPSHLPRIPHMHPYQQAPRRGRGYDPSMTLEEALNGGFITDAVEQKMNDQRNRSSIDGSIPRNTGYGPDTRISWNQNNLVPDRLARRSE